MNDIIIAFRYKKNNYDMVFEVWEIESKTLYAFNNVLSNDKTLTEKQLNLYRELKNISDFDFVEKQWVYAFVYELYKNWYDIKFSKDDYIAIIENIINSNMVTLTKILHYIDWNSTGIWNNIYWQYTYAEWIIRNWNDLKSDTIDWLNKTSLKWIFEILNKLI